MFLKIYELNSPNFISTPGLVWQAALQKTKGKLDLLVDIGMLLIYRAVCHVIHCYGKANNKYMKDNDKNKESPYLKY